MGKKQIFKVLITVFLMVFTCGAGAADKQRSKLCAVPFTDVVIADQFWARRIETNRRVSIPFAFKKCEQTGRISNFAKAGGLIEGEFQGTYFNDSDVYKVIEAAAYSLKMHPDEELENYVDSVIDKIAAAQWKDGYLFTYYSLPEKKPWKRWIDRGMHELYCAGHFFEAAVAYYQATGKRKALGTAVKLADYIDSVFGPDKHIGTPGHQEIEIGLVKLYSVTQDEKYLKLAKFFLDMRGKGHDRKNSGIYGQDHKPVIEQSEAVGHAVRATYMYCGMADVAALTRDADYIRAIDRIWENVVTAKLYITGGIGASGGGEAFGENYQLPNAKAYCETCAAIANAMWNHRLFLLHADAKYIDVLERVLYNGFLSGVSLSGDRFFYPNPLASDGRHKRSPWFGCACCPTNVARFMPSVGGYVYASSGDSLYVNLFVAGSARFKIGDNRVVLKQRSRYPWGNVMRLTVEPERPAEFAIYVRIPGWAQNRPVPGDLYHYLSNDAGPVILKVNGRSVALDMKKGFARIRRAWKKGDIIELRLPMPIRRLLCHEKVSENAGKVALERGPVVYCFEGVDNGGTVKDIFLPDEAALWTEHRPGLLGGLTVIRGKISVSAPDRRDGQIKAVTDKEIFAIPYYAWAHRRSSEMAVWVPKKNDRPVESGKRFFPQLHYATDFLLDP